MGVRNFLVEGVSCAGKTAVCDELLRRGHQAIHGDRELAYQGDPETGEPIGGTGSHRFHIWHVDRVRSLVASDDTPLTFFCGGSRNFPRFIDLFDGVFVLDIDRDTLITRLGDRPEDEFGTRPDERALVLRLHRTMEDVPSGGIRIDATAPLTDVVDDILRIVHK